MFMQKLLPHYFSLVSTNPVCVCVCLCVCVSVSVSVCVYHIFLIHLSVDGHLHCFHILATINSAAKSIGMPVSLQTSVVVFSWYISRSGIARSYGSSVCNCLRNLHTVLHVDYQFTFQPTVYKGVLFSTPSPAFILLRFFLMIASLSSVR